MTANGSASLTINLDVPDGYFVAAVVSLSLSNWACAISKFDLLSTDQYSVNVSNVRASQQNTSATIEVLLLPD